MSRIFTEWNQGELDSFLIEISANILKFKYVKIFSSSGPDLVAVLRNRNRRNRNFLP